MIAWMAKNSVASNLLMVFLIVGGLLIGTTVKQEFFPEFDLDRININVPYAGATPAEVEEGIILPIEDVVTSIVGIKTVTSTAYENFGSVSLELEGDVDADKVLDDIKSAVDSITIFPEKSEKPVITLLKIKGEVINAAVYGDASEKALRETGEMIKDELLSHPDISQVELNGIRDYEIHIDVSQRQLKRFDLTTLQIAAKIKNATLDLPGGKLKTTGGNILIRTKERRYSAREFEEIPIIEKPEGIVLLKDIADVQEGFEDNEVLALFNGKSAVLLDVYRVGSETPKKVAKATIDTLENLKNRLPTSIKTKIVYDRAIILDDRIDLLIRNAKLGLILVLLLLTLFLEIKLAFWIMLGIPISFLGAMFLMPAMDVSINMISLFAFILVLGMVVDDAIVVGENIYSHRQMGKSSLTSSIEGTIEIAAPVLMAILTTVCAFIPLLLVPGTMGKVFKVIPLIVISVLLISLIECWFILPSHLAHSKIDGNRWWGFKIPDWLCQHASVVLQKVVNGPYKKILELAIKFRYVTLSIAIAMILFNIGYVGGGHIKFNFFPKIDSDIVFVSLTMPFGTPFNTTKNIHDKLIADARIVADEFKTQKGHSIDQGVFSLVGANIRGVGGVGSHMTNIIFFLEPLNIRGFAAAEFAKKWKERVGDIPGIDNITFNYSTGMGVSEDINAQISHSDFLIAEKIADRLKTGLENYPGVNDINDSYEEGKTEIQLSLKPKAYGMGMNTQNLAQQVNAAFQGLEVLRFQKGNNEVKVVIRYPESERQSVKDLHDFIVQTSEGREIALAEVANISFGKSFSHIKRVDGKRVINVTASVDDKIANTQEIIRSLTSGILEDLKNDYPSLNFEFVGSQKQMKESMDSLIKGGGLALLMIYSLLALQFKNYFQPLVVMIAIPFGVIGAIIGHVIMGYELSLISLLGLVALSGVVVNDSLILVDFINKKRRESLPIYEAVISSGIRRFRPIILTSFTTFFGLIPMIFEKSLQARFLIPMAISLGFGIIFSTFIILLLIPSLYTILTDFTCIFSKFSGLFRNQVAFKNYQE